MRTFITYCNISSMRSIHHWCRFCKTDRLWWSTSDTCIQRFQCGCTDFTWCIWGLHLDSHSLQALKECRQWWCKFRQDTLLIKHKIIITKMLNNLKIKCVGTRSTDNKKCLFRWVWKDLEVGGFVIIWKRLVDYPGAKTAQVQSWVHCGFASANGSCWQ